MPHVHALFLGTDVAPRECITVRILNEYSAMKPTRDQVSYAPWDPKVKNQGWTRRSTRSLLSLLNFALAFHSALSTPHSLELVELTQNTPCSS